MKVLIVLSVCLINVCWSKQNVESTKQKRGIYGGLYNGLGSYAPGFDGSSYLPSSVGLGSSSFLPSSVGLGSSSFLPSSFGLSSSSYLPSAISFGAPQTISVKSHTHTHSTIDRAVPINRPYAVPIPHEVPIHRPVAIDRPVPVPYPQWVFNNDISIRLSEQISDKIVSNAIWFRYHTSPHC